MKRILSIATASLFAVLAVLAPHVQAQQSNSTDRTFMTFSSPVELPGVTLEAGTYEFTLADNQKGDVVQVFRKDDREILGQWTFVATERPRVSDETVVMFRETREGTTPAVQYWYYPGEKVGKEFIYPKDQAQRIAARTGQTVRAEDGPVTSTAANAPAPAAVPPARPEPPRVAAATPDADAARPAEPLEDARPQQSAQADTPPVPRPVGTSGSAAADAQERPAQVASNELPRTASPLALTGLIGLLSLAGALGIRAFRL